MYYCTLKKIESTHNNLRTEEVNGLVVELPVIGGRVFMYSNETLTQRTNTRYILTTPIKDVRVNSENGDIVFYTENSVYALINIRKADPSNE